MILKTYLGEQLLIKYHVIKQSIAKNAKYGYERGLASVIYRSVDQILEGVNKSSGAAIKS